MKSEAKTVDGYLDEVLPERQRALIKLRKTCVEILSGYEEDMTYKMPCYKKNGVVEVAFASQKQHICFYVLKHDVMLNNQEALKNTNHGKGCIRYSKPESIDYNLVQKLLKETVESESSIC